MALTKSAGATSAKAVFVHSAPAGSGGTVYTVPSGKVFKGFITVRNNTSNFTVTISQVSVTYQLGSNGENSEFNIILPPDTVVSNNSTNYFTLSGELVDGS